LGVVRKGVRKRAPIGLHERESGKKRKIPNPKQFHISGLKKRRKKNAGESEASKKQGFKLG